MKSLLKLFVAGSAPVLVGGPWQVVAFADVPASQPATQPSTQPTTQPATPPIPPPEAPPIHPGGLGGRRG